MNEDKPKVTVLMSVYNDAGHLSEAIESIIAQTLGKWEFIIVDDGSTDRTGDTLRLYAEHDNRIKVLTNRENIGLTRSLNIAFGEAQGQFVARQDADDISVPSRLEKQVAYLEKYPEVAVVGCLADVFNASGLVIRSRDRKFSRAGIKRYLAKNNLLVHGSVIIRRSCLEEVGLYREFFRYAQDYDLWLRLLQHFDLDVLPEHLYRYRVSAGAIGASRYLAQKWYADIARKLHAERLATGSDSYNSLASSYPDGLPPRKQVIDKFHHRLIIAKQLILANRLNIARKELLEAWELGCRKPQLFWLFFKTCLGSWMLDRYRELRDLKFRL